MAGFTSLLPLMIDSAIELACIRDHWWRIIKCLTIQSVIYRNVGTGSYRMLPNRIEDNVTSSV